MSFEEQSLLLKFVTACPRPPSLGFGSLTPRFTIQKIDNPDDNRLPSASTCFNVLKLPSYSSEKKLKEKLLYALHSKSGFDLS
jgi:ubiquitin-protein ligase E3 C